MMDDQEAVRSVEMLVGERVGKMADRKVAKMAASMVS